MSSSYKMDPAAWDFGTAELTLEQEDAYLRIVNAIHKHDQPVPNNDRVLAGMFRCSTRKARAMVDSLVAVGKLHIEGNRITNDRAISDLVHRRFVSISRSESGAKGGRTRANSAATILKFNEKDQENVSSRIEKVRIDNGGGGSACAREPEDTLRERILIACGADPVSGLTGPNGNTLGSRIDMGRAARWQTDLGLDHDTILAVVSEAMAGKRDGPPSRFTYFDKAMAREAARRAAPPLTPADIPDTRPARPTGHGTTAQNPRRISQQITSVAANGPT